LYLDGIVMISESDIEKAQRLWGQGIVEIAAAHRAGADYVQRAKDHITTLYAYDLGPVLFKPTLAVKQQFRPSFEGALSYFVASNNACPEDKGFAIKGWTKVRFENAGLVLNESNALAMGNYFFTAPDGEETKVEFTFGYILDSNNKLRINLHHSSLIPVIE